MDFTSDKTKKVMWKKLNLFTLVSELFFNLVSTVHFELQDGLQDEGPFNLLAPEFYI
jgi:hypothetical protein